MQGQRDVVFSQRMSQARERVSVGWRDITRSEYSEVGSMKARRPALRREVSRDKQKEVREVWGEGRDGKGAVPMQRLAF